jgi:hypothetical protein
MNQFLCNLSQLNAFGAVAKCADGIAGLENQQRREGRQMRHSQTHKANDWKAVVGDKRIWRRECSTVSQSDTDNVERGRLLQAANGRSPTLSEL